MINPTDDLREVLERGARWNALAAVHRQAIMIGGRRRAIVRRHACARV